MSQDELNNKNKWHMNINELSLNAKAQDKAIINCNMYKLLQGFYM